MKRFTKIILGLIITALLATISTVCASAVTLARPTITSATSASYSSVLIKWGKVTNAKSYTVYRSTDNASWKQIASVTTLSYTDKGLTCGKTYYYTLRAVSGSSRSGYNKGTAVKVIPSTPTVSSTVGKSTTSVAVTWNKISGANGYYLYRSTKKTSGWTKIATIKSQSTVTYTDKNCKSGTVYYYTVRAYRTVSGTNVLSNYVKTGKAGIPLPATTKLKSAESAGYNSVKVTWSAVTGATSYKIYRKYGTTGWQGLATVSGGTTVTYTDYTCTTGTKYTYTVRAMQTADSVTSTGGYNSTGVAATPIPSTPILSSAVSVGYNSVKISWGKVTGATSYTIYRKVASGSWSTVATVSGNTTVTYTDKTCTTGTAYTYTVRAVTKNSNGSYKSGYNSTGVTATPKLDVPVISEVKATDYRTVRISWNKIEGATGYILHRKAENSDWENYAIISSGLSYTDTDCKVGVKYTYKVQATIKVNNTLICGDFSTQAPWVATSLNAPVLNEIKQTEDNLVNLIWSNPEGVDYCYIYRKIGGGSFEKISGKVTETEYTDTARKADVELTYAVCGVSEYSDGGSYTTEHSNPLSITVTPKLKTVTVTAVTALDYSTICITWNEVIGADSYKIYRKAENSDWQEYDMTHGDLSYNDANCRVGVNYTYKVQAAVNIDNVYYYGDISSEEMWAHTTMSAPALIDIQQVNCNTVNLSWSKSDGADSYYIYRKSGNGSFEKISEVINGTDCTDTTCEAGKEYTYAVCAVKIYTADDIYITDYSNSLSFTTDIAVPTLLSVESVSFNAIKITWQKLSDAQSYCIYRKENNDPAYVKIDQVNGDITEYTDNTCVTGSQYYYTVSAVNGTYEGKYDINGLSAVAQIPAPQLISLDSNVTGVLTLTYTAVNSADGYIIYRKASGGDFAEIATVNGAQNTVYNDSTVLCGTSYTYTVCAYISVDNETAEGLRDEVGLTKIPYPMTPDVSVETDGLCAVISITEDVNADGYYIYRSVNGLDPELLAQTDNHIYNDTSINYADEYIYSVQTFVNVENQAVTSEMSQQTDVVTVLPPAPAITGTDSTENEIIIKFNTVKNITSYKVYRSEALTSWQFIGKINTEDSALSAQYSDISAQYGKTYSYTVTAVAYTSEANSRAVESNYAQQTDNIKLKLPVPVVEKVDFSTEYGFRIYANPIEKADSYLMYKKGGQYDQFTLCGTSYQNLSGYICFDDDDIYANTEYEYAVTAIYINDESDKSDSKNISYTPSAPTAQLSFDPADASYTVTLTNDVYHALRYELYRRYDDTSYELAGTFSGNTCTDNSNNLSKNSAYMVRAVIPTYTGGEANISGSELTYNFTEAAPSVLWLRKSGSSSVIAFSPAEGTSADTFNIYRSSDGNTFKYIGYQKCSDNNSTVYYRDKSSGNYTYVLIAVNGNSYSLPSSTYIKAYDAVKSATAISAVKTNDGINFTFESDINASSYTIFRGCNQNTAAFMDEIATVAPSEDGTITYTDNTYPVIANKITTFYYCAIPDYSITYYDYGTSANATVKFAKSLDSMVHVTLGVDTPEIIDISPDAATNGTSITWQSITNVSEYKVYRKDSENSAYEFIGQTASDTATFIDSETPFTEYKYYMIVTCANVLGEALESPIDAVGTKADISLAVSSTVTDTVLASDGNVYVKFDISKLGSSYSYHIFRRANEQDNWTYLGYQKQYNSNETSLTFCDETSGNEYGCQYAVMMKGENAYSPLCTAYTHTECTVDKPTVTTVSSDGIMISVPDVPNIKYLKIYRRAESETEFTLITTLNAHSSGDNYTYTDKTVQQGQNYFYMVVADKSATYTSNNDVSSSELSYIATFSSPISDSICTANPDVNIMIFQPVIQEEDGQDHMIHAYFYWAKASGAVGYKVYRQTNGGEFEVISGDTPITTNAFTDPSPISRYYVYAVQAVYSNGTYSDYNNSKIATSDYFTVSDPGLYTSGVYSDGSIGLEWHDVSNSADAYEYYIYRRLHGTTEWEYIGERGTLTYDFTSYSDTSAKYGCTYDYTMCVLVYDGDYTFYSGFDYESKVVTAECVANAPIIYFVSPDRTSTDVDDYAPMVTWQKFSGTTTYIIYRKYGANGQWSQIDTVDGTLTSYTDSTVSYFEDYYYSVAAIISYPDGTTYTTPYNTVGMCAIDKVDEIIEELNEYRAKNSLYPLSFDTELWKAATIRAKEISTVFSHTRPDDTEFSTVLSDMDIPYLDTTENIAYNYNYTAAYVINQWDNSEGHKANMLSTKSSKVGVGFYYDSTGGMNWVQLFIG